MPQENASSRIAIPTKNGTVFLKEEEIVYCQSQGSYTYIYLNHSNNKKLIISKPLNAVVAMLNSPGIVRLHQAFAANLTHIIQLNGSPNDYVTLSNGVELALSRTRKEAFMNYFKVI